MRTRTHIQRLKQPPDYDPLDPANTVCDVCGNPAALVAASPFGPYSNAYCGDCILHAAEPSRDFEITYILTDGHVAAWIRTLQTFVDGRYLTWDEWVAARS